MNRRFAISTILVAALAIPAYARAHGGHVHKVMGTVSQLHENHLEVTATDGKTWTVTVTEKTRILRGKTKATAEEIKTGERVVVTAAESKDKDGKAAMIATEVRLPKEVASK